MINSKNKTNLDKIKNQNTSLILINDSTKLKITTLKLKQKRLERL